MQFSSLFFKIVHDTGQQLMIDRTNFLTDGFLQIIQSTGFVSVNTRFQIPPKKKITRWKIGRARGPGTSPEREMRCPGKHVSNNGHWLVCSVCCGTILLKPHTGTLYSSSAQFWVLPIQKMLGSRALPCISNTYIHPITIRHQRQMKMLLPMQAWKKKHLTLTNKRPFWESDMPYSRAQAQYWSCCTIKILLYTSVSYIRGLLEKYPTVFFYANTWWIII